jgi:hypothetical protein
MQISETALGGFINSYKAEFDEDIGRDEARIIARNLVPFYLELEQRGMLQAAIESQGRVPSESPGKE